MISAVLPANNRSAGIQNGAMPTLHMAPARQIAVEHMGGGEQRKMIEILHNLFCPQDGVLTLAAIALLPFASCARIQLQRLRTRLGRRQFKDV